MDPDFGDTLNIVYVSYAYWLGHTRLTVKIWETCHSGTNIPLQVWIPFLSLYKYNKIWCVVPHQTMLRCICSCLDMTESLVSAPMYRLRDGATPHWRPTNQSTNHTIYENYLSWYVSLKAVWTLKPAPMSFYIMSFWFTWFAYRYKYIISLTQI